MKATELPALRNRILRYLDSPLARDTWNYHADRNEMFGGRMPVDAFGGKGPQVLAQERNFWQHGELFYVTAEMTQVAVVAAKSLPDYRLQEADLPSDFGVIYFEVPFNNGASIGSYDGVPKRTKVQACAWGRAYAMDAPCVWLSFWADQRNTMEQQVALGQYTAADAEHALRLLAPLGLDDELLWRFNVPGNGQLDTSDETVTGMGAVIRAAWLLMQQPLATITTAHPRKAEVRRMKRHHIDPKAVRIISLRRTAQAATDPGDGTGRSYDHRWVVRGHWRQQWYPSRNDHLPIWISPHVKGPDGAPLLTGEKVNAWRR